MTVIIASYKWKLFSLYNFPYKYTQYIDHWPLTGVPRMFHSNSRPGSVGIRCLDAGLHCTARHGSVVSGVTLNRTGQSGRAGSAWIWAWNYKVRWVFFYTQLFLWNNAAARCPDSSFRKNQQNKKIRSKFFVNLLYEIREFSFFLLFRRR